SVDELWKVCMEIGGDGVGDGTERVVEVLLGEVERFEKMKAEIAGKVPWSIGRLQAPAVSSPGSRTSVLGGSAESSPTMRGGGGGGGMGVGLGVGGMGSPGGKAFVQGGLGFGSKVWDATASSTSSTSSHHHSYNHHHSHGGGSDSWEHLQMQVHFEQQAYQSSSSASVSSGSSYGRSSPLDVYESFGSGGGGGGSGVGTTYQPVPSRFGGFGSFGGNGGRRGIFAGLGMGTSTISEEFVFVPPVGGVGQYEFGGVQPQQQPQQQQNVAVGRSAGGEKGVVGQGRGMAANSGGAGATGMGLGFGGDYLAGLLPSSSASPSSGMGGGGIGGGFGLGLGGGSARFDTEDVPPRMGTSPFDDYFSGSITPGSARFDVPARLLSPPVFKRPPPDPMELQRKQAKAQELRDSLLIDKTARLRSKAERAQMRKSLLLEQQKILRESIEEKHAKAEKLRELYLKSIQDKAKEESQKLDEIAFISAMTIENRKNEVAQRHLDSEARRHELEEERLRKLSGTNALQENAMERRRQQEVERAKKLAREEERKKELEARREREKREALAKKVAQREEKMRRVAEGKRMKIAEEEEITQKRKMNAVLQRRERHEKLRSKLEKGVKRHDEMIERKKGRAAEKNLNAKAAALNAVNSRRTPEPGGVCAICGEEDDDLKSHYKVHRDAYRLSPNLPLWNVKLPQEEVKIATIAPRDKNSKRKAKKIRQRCKDASETYVFIPHHSTTSSPSLSSTPHSQLRHHLDQITSLLNTCHRRIAGAVGQARLANTLAQSTSTTSRTLVVPNGGVGPDQGLLGSLNGVMESVARELEEWGGEGDGEEEIAGLVVGSGVVAGVVRALGVVGDPEMGGRGTIQNAIHILLLSCQSKACREHLLLSSDTLALDLCEVILRLLSSIIPGSGEDKVDASHGSGALSSEAMMLAASMLDLMRLLVRSSADDASEALLKAQDDLIGYILCIEVLDKISDVLMAIHGPLNENHLPEVIFLQRCLAFLEAFCVYRTRPNGPTKNVPDPFKKSDPTSLAISASMQRCDLPGVVVTMLASLALSGNPNAPTTTIAAAAASRIAVEDDDGEGGGRGRVEEWAVVEVSLRGIRMLNLLCGLDLGMVQNVLASEAIQFQFFHLVVFWIQNYAKHCMVTGFGTASFGNADESEAAAAVAGGDGEAEGNGPLEDGGNNSDKTSPSRLLLQLFHELLLLLGHACLDNAANSAILRFVTGQPPILPWISNRPGGGGGGGSGRDWMFGGGVGDEKSSLAVEGGGSGGGGGEGTGATVLLQMLVGVLPFGYFCLPGLREVAFPTLVVACAGDEANVQVVGEDLDLGALVRWIREWIGKVKRQKEKTKNGKASSSSGKMMVASAAERDASYTLDGGSGGCGGVQDVWQCGEEDEEFERDIFVDLVDDSEEAREVGRKPFVSRARFFARVPADRWEKCALEIERGMEVDFGQGKED
ncbi:hypothetical protein HDU97_007140, partial [Phlyctochytrium planicorne]